MIQFRRILGMWMLLGLSVGAMLTAGCGGGGGGDKADESGLSGARVTQGTATPVVVVEQIVEVKDNSFAPQTVSVKSGTKVVWKWTGTSNAHSIQVSGSTSPAQTSGTFERLFSQGAGTFNYQCGVHKEAMSGKIVIE